MTHPSASRTIRLLLAIALGGLAVTVSGIALWPVPSAAQAQTTVGIVEPDRAKPDTWKFDPPEITVKAGTTVVWDWRGDDKHSATADDGSFDSGIIQQRGATWQHKFGGPGEFPYSCTPHPYMIGKVTVT
jgi:plastocyanin